MLVLKIPAGIDKPYRDNNGIVWLKNGSDKRRVTSKEELRRLFQSADLIHADEVPVKDTNESDINLAQFMAFYEKEYEEELDVAALPLIQLFENLNLAKQGNLNLAGLLMFGKSPDKYKPTFIVKSVYFVGNDASSEY